MDFVGVATIIAIVLAVVFWGLKKLQQPVVLEGKIVGKKISLNREELSSLTIETPDGKTSTVQFNVFDTSILVQAGGKYFHDNVEELNKAISLRDDVRVGILHEWSIIRIEVNKCPVTRVSVMLKVGH